MCYLQFLYSTFSLYTTETAEQKALSIRRTLTLYCARIFCKRLLLGIVFVFLFFLGGLIFSLFSECFSARERERETETETETDRQTDRETHTHTHTHNWANTTL